MSTEPEQPKASRASSGRGGDRRGSRSGKAGPPASGTRDRDTRSRPRPVLTSRAAILALVICVIALSLAYPLREYVAQRAEIAQLRKEQAETQENVERLQKRYDELQDPTYIERAARTRLHYTYPGERSYVIVTGEDPDRENAGSGESSDPWFTQLWKSVKAADQAGTEKEKIPEAKAPEH